MLLFSPGKFCPFDQGRCSCSVRCSSTNMAPLINISISFLSYFTFLYYFLSNVIILLAFLQPWHSFHCLHMDELVLKPSAISFCNVTCSKTCTKVSAGQVEITRVVQPHLLMNASLPSLFMAQTVEDIHDFWFKIQCRSQLVSKYCEFIYELLFYTFKFICTKSDYYVYSSLIEIYVFPFRSTLNLCFIDFQ